MVIPLRKKEIFSIVTNHSKNQIIRRLYEAQKASYSDLLDTIGLKPSLDSTGNFNYHLNFLIKNEIVSKSGSIYRLTDKGKEIALFIKEIDHKWKKLEKIMNGENMSIISLAEQFEEETGIRMLKELSDFKGLEIVFNEIRSLGIIITNDKPEPFSNHEEIDIENLQVVKMEQKGKTRFVLGYPKMNHYLSNRYFGTIQEFLTTNFDGVHVYTDKSEISPFLMSSIELGLEEQGIVFLIAPIINE